MRYKLILIIQFLSSNVCICQWEVLSSPTERNLRGVSFIDSLHGWVAGDSGTILQTNNAGATWRKQPIGSIRNLLSISFCDSLYGWAVGPHGTILHTTNGGSQWIRVYFDTSLTIDYFKVQCINAQTAIILRNEFLFDYWDNYRILQCVRSSSGTVNCSDRSPDNSRFFDVDFHSLSLGWACGGDGSDYRLHRYFDMDPPFGLIAWESQSFNWPTLGNGLLKISLADSVHGLTTDGDTVYLTANGGVSWEAVSTYQFGGITDLTMTNSTTAFATQYHSILRTTDGGRSWQELSTSFDPLTWIYDINFSDSNHGWVVGNRGFIARTVNGGGTTVSVHNALKELPDRDFMNEAYPNPFNPVTSIHYQISKPEVVGVKVYNLLGEEMATLVSERKEAGSHIVRWNAGDLPGGLYFCRLIAGSFIQTRKLLLIR